MYRPIGQSYRSVDGIRSRRPQLSTTSTPVSDCSHSPPLVTKTPLKYKVFLFKLQWWITEYLQRRLATQDDKFQQKAVGILDPNMVEIVLLEIFIQRAQEVACTPWYLCLSSKTCNDQRTQKTAVCILIVYYQNLLKYQTETMNVNDMKI